MIENLVIIIIALAIGYFIDIILDDISKFLSYATNQNFTTIRLIVTALYLIVLCGYIYTHTTILKM